MRKKKHIKEYIESLISSKRLGNQVVHNMVLPDNSPCLSKPEKSWPEEINYIMESTGIKDLFKHQVDAVDLIRSGRHLVVATPTASGKTLIYNLPEIGRAHV